MWVTKTEVVPTRSCPLGHRVGLTAILLGTVTEVQGDVDALQAALKGDDEEAVKTAFDKLVLSQGKLGEAIYSSASGDDAPADESDEAEAAESSDEDIVDAEVVEDEPSTDPKK